MSTLVTFAANIPPKSISPSIITKVLMVEKPAWANTS